MKTTNWHLCFYSIRELTACYPIDNLQVFRLCRLVYINSACDILCNQIDLSPQKQIGEPVPRCNKNKIILRGISRIMCYVFFWEGPQASRQAIRQSGRHMSHERDGKSGRVASCPVALSYPSFRTFHDTKKTHFKWLRFLYGMHCL